MGEGFLIFFRGEEQHHWLPGLLGRRVRLPSDGSRTPFSVGGRRCYSPFMPRMVFYTCISGALRGGGPQMLKEWPGQTCHCSFCLKLHKEGSGIHCYYWSFTIQARSAMLPDRQTIKRAFMFLPEGTLEVLWQECLVSLFPIYMAGLTNPNPSSSFTPVPTVPKRTLNLWNLTWPTRLCPDQSLCSTALWSRIGWSVAFRCCLTAISLIPQCW